MGSSRTGSADSNKRLPSTLTLEIFPRVDTWEYYVIALDEGDIEKLPQTPVTAKALRWIDMRQRDGTYLAARRQVAEQQGLNLEAENQRPKTGTKYIKNQTYLGRSCLYVHAALRLTMAGMKPEARKQYEEAAKIIRNIRDDLEVQRWALHLTPPVGWSDPNGAVPRRKGRKLRGFPNDRDQKCLLRMRILINSGLSIAGAAAQIAKEIHQPMVDEESVKKRLERWWRWKMKLREDPEW